MWAARQEGPGVKVWELGGRAAPKGKGEAELTLMEGERDLYGGPGRDSLGPGHREGEEGRWHPEGSNVGKHVGVRCL